MRRPLVIIGAAAVLAGGAIAGFMLAGGSGDNAPAATPGLPPATATVTRTTLVATQTESGTLGYAEPVPVAAIQRGTITWMAPVGSTVRRGAPLFRIDERPVVALYGSLPLYRPLVVGATGRDVRELERNLAALGYGGFPTDGTYTAATAAAVRSWQAKLGLPESGTIELGQVVFAPGPIRIAAQTAQVGGMLGGPGQGGGPVLSYTSTTRQVTVDLDVADQALAVKGRAVTVTLPAGGTVQGRISEVATVVTEQAAPQEGEGPPGGSSSSNTTQVEVTVTIADQSALRSLQAATVDVDFVSDRRANVLAVPVSALLALPGGGFGVQVVGGATTQIVPVTTGLFAAAEVEISGKGIAAGMKVGIPK